MHADSAGQLAEAPCGETQLLLPIEAAMIHCYALVDTKWPNAAFKLHLLVHAVKNRPLDIATFGTGLLWDSLGVACP